jgi:hypothetical protein
VLKVHKVQLVPKVLQARTARTELTVPRVQLAPKVRLVKTEPTVLKVPTVRSLLAMAEPLQPRAPLSQRVQRPSRLI